MTIQVADGSYTAGGAIAAPWTGGGALIIQGASRSNTAITTSAALFMITAALPGQLTIQSFKLKTTNVSAACIHHNGSGTLQAANIEINGQGNAGYGGAFVAEGPGAVLIMGGSNICTADCETFFHAPAGTIRLNGQTYTLTGTINFSWVFARAAGSGSISQTSFFNTAGATVTGKRFDASNGGIINSAGGGASHFPGSIAGTGTNFSVSPWGLYL